MAQNLRLRFQAAEELFLTAFSKGATALSTFDETWAALSSDFKTSVKTCQVDAETMSIADATSSRISVLADSLLSLNITADSVQNAFTAECSTLLSQDDEEYDVPSVVPPPATLSALCHRWLLQHVHDPYPSSTAKSSIAEGCNCSVKAVEQWFVAARRHIGWSALSSGMFGGSRRATAAAALLAFNSDVSNNDQPAEIRRAFLAIKAKAIELSPDHCHRIGDEVDSLQSDIGSDSFHHDALLDAPQLPQLLPLPGDSEEDTTPPLPIAGHKRRFSDDGHGHTPLSVNVRPSKRNRTSSLLREDTLKTQHTREILPESTFVAESSNPSSSLLPSQPESFSSGFSASDISSVVSATSITFPPLSRKRRFSDPAASDPPKRPRGLTTSHRKHAVSDPLPVHPCPAPMAASGAESWLRRDHELSQASDTDHLDSSRGAADLTQPADLSAFSFFTEPVPSTSEMEIPDADLVSATSPGFDLSDFTFLNTFISLPNSPFSPSQTSSGYSPSSAGSLPDILEQQPDMTPSQDWSQFVDLFDPSFTSPNCLTDYSTSSQTMDSPSRFIPADSSQTLFDVNPLLTSSDLFDIDELSSLSLPLQSVF